MVELPQCDRELPLKLKQVHLNINGTWIAKRLQVGMCKLFELGKCFDDMLDFLDHMVAYQLGMGCVYASSRRSPRGYAKIFSA